MIGVGIITMFLFYDIASYGWVMVKGYDITLRQWSSPLNPYTWPAPGEDIPRVPKGHIWPTGSAGPGSNSTSPGKNSPAPAAGEGGPRPPLVI
jgi:hypothetical protein